MIYEYGKNFGFKDIELIKIEIDHSTCDFTINIHYHQCLDPIYSIEYSYVLNFSEYALDISLSKKSFKNTCVNYKEDQGPGLHLIKGYFMLENKKFYNFLYEEINKFLKKYSPKIVYKFGV